MPLFRVIVEKKGRQSLILYPPVHKKSRGLLQSTSLRGKELVFSIAPSKFVPFPVVSSVITLIKTSVSLVTPPTRHHSSTSSFLWFPLPISCMTSSHFQDPENRLIPTHSYKQALKSVTHASEENKMPDDIQSLFISHRHVSNYSVL